MKTSFITPPHATPMDDISDLKLTGITPYKVFMQSRNRGDLKSQGKVLRQEISILKRFKLEIRGIFTPLFSTWEITYEGSVIVYRSRYDLQRVQSLH